MSLTPHPQSEPLDAAYNNMARVPDSAARIAAWRARSAAVELPWQELAYGEAASERLDWWGPGGRPLLVFIHGGYWRALGKADFRFVAPPFVAAGMDVAVLDYALAPAVRIAHIARQMAQAVAWLVRTRRPPRLIVAGHSAGGHLAAMLSGCHWPAVDARLPRRVVHGALALSGLYDLRPLRRTPFLQRDLRLTPASARRLSPALWPAPRGARVHALVGAQESAAYLWHTQLLREAWGAAAVPVCAALPGLDHFSIVDALAEPDSAVHREALSLLTAA